ncbi:unnamed protein product [Vitrella brassicaformis CCMP3155]|uniref:histone deacetylase n=3 Tax=Vitrella brassicaformis TaxID=1169539 RepID=A0A0G4G958_VITBC|nr:unnamed protein product [Vitrella brassicaformis CCMP3155]|eukprot:CEM25321.1 unnamed protein product [Vitrella brassicaformis CCMP3155]
MASTEPAEGEQLAASLADRLKAMSTSDERSGASPVEAGRAARPSVAVVYDPFVLKHAGPPHVESPSRVQAIMNGLEESGLLSRTTQLTPRCATKEDVMLCHTERHVDRVLGLFQEKEGEGEGEGEAKEPSASAAEEATEEDLVDEEENFVVMPKKKPWIYPFGADTFVCKYTPEAALRAAGAVLTLCDEVYDQSSPISKGYVVMRPPGHHASANQAEGFCLFNNAAIGAQYARTKHGARKVLILDWDVHHGNGTQNIFWTDPDVFYCSTHRYSFFYPNTGDMDEMGEGEGFGATLNVPLDYLYDDTDMYAIFEHVIVPLVHHLQPDLFVVSHGMDAVELDPLGECHVSPGFFGWMTEQMCRLAEIYADGKVILVLEGGYNLSMLSEASIASVKALLKPIGRDPALTAETFHLSSLEPWTGGFPAHRVLRDEGDMRRYPHPSYSSMLVKKLEQVHELFSPLVPLPPPPPMPEAEPTPTPPPAAAPRTRRSTRPSRGEAPPRPEPLVADINGLPRIVALAPGAEAPSPGESNSPLPGPPPPPNTPFSPVEESPKDVAADLSFCLDEGNNDGEEMNDTIRERKLVPVTASQMAQLGGHPDSFFVYEGDESKGDNAKVVKLCLPKEAEFYRGLYRMALTPSHYTDSPTTLPSEPDYRINAPTVQGVWTEGAEELVLRMEEVDWARQLVMLTPPCYYIDLNPKGLSHVQTDEDEEDREENGTEGRPKRCLIELGNLVGGLSVPCQCDIKMGYRLYDDEASDAKRDKMIAKANEQTTAKYGIAVTAYTAHRSDGSSVELSRPDAKRIQTMDEITQAMIRWLRGDGPADERAIDIAKRLMECTRRVDAFFKVQRHWSFYSSSLLYVYDGAADSPVESADVRMIDFGHVAAGTDRLDEGYLGGLEHLMSVWHRVIEALEDEATPEPPV